MQVEERIYYRAMRSRDSRFDGRFFAGVVTTGVYCRPVCPAPKPLVRNVRFYSCAAAAEAAGFRPCMRCRPEASPGTPAWAGTSTTVSRAMRLIAAGFLDHAGVDELAGTLGVGGRHLRRLFVEHLGVSPVAVAHTRRVHFAKLLLDGTPLPMSAVAMNAGFGSIRRFNDAIRRTFARTPTEIRATARRRNGRGEAGAADDATRDTGAAVEMCLAYRLPIDWDGLLRFYSARAIAGMESVRDGRYRRLVRVGNAQGVVTVRHDHGRRVLCVAVTAGLSGHLGTIAERVRRMFDLGADPGAIAEHLREDPWLRSLVKRHPGVRVPGAWDPFEAAARAVLGQQITVQAATTLAGRVAERYGDMLYDVDGRPLGRAFPGPERLVRARLADVGITRTRARTLRAVARAFLTGAVPHDGGASLSDLTHCLERIDGVGSWTAHYVAMRGYGEPDAFPAADLGLRRAASYLGRGRLPRANEIEQRAMRWRPWRAYAAVYLWRAYAAMDARAFAKKGA